MNKFKISEGVGDYRKMNMRTRESSLSSIGSDGSQAKQKFHQRYSSHQRNNSYLFEVPFQPKHTRTVSTIDEANFIEENSIQKEIISKVAEMQAEKKNNNEKIKEQKKKIKELLIKQLGQKTSTKLKKKTGKTNKIKQILSYFFGTVQHSSSLSKLFKAKLKKYFVAVKNKTFAVFSKDTGSWKRIFGDSSIKITKNTGGSKYLFTSEGLTRDDIAHSYNIFILK